MQVMLCDITSGGFTHTLSGHRGAVWAIHWSLQSEWQLMTGERAAGGSGLGHLVWGIWSGAFGLGDLVWGILSFC